MIYRARYWHGDDIVHFVDFPCTSTLLINETLDAVVPDPPRHEVVTVSPRKER